VNGSLVSLEEYLNSSSSPDREYVDGVVRERNAGERAHSKVESNFIMALASRYSDLCVWPILRVRTAPTRIRLPDICVTLEDPRTDIFEAPPFICIEILSRRDEKGDLLGKLDEYAAMGVAHIWVVDPSRRTACTYRNRELVEVTGGRFETEEPEISVPLEEVFHDL
jgi:Uma2 family endonuclease